MMEHCFPEKQISNLDLLHSWTYGMISAYISNILYLVQNADCTLAFIDLLLANTRNDIWIAALP